VGKIAVVTDSAACLPEELLQQYGIHVVPFGLIWGDEVLRDGIDITPEVFYHRLRTSEELPTTSQPSLGDFLRVYQPLAGKVDGIVSIHIPQALSGTVSGAQAAARLLGEMPVRVVDSGTAVMAQGFVVLAAARAAAAGAGLDEVVRAAEEMVPRVHLLAALDRLDYLARSGRVPGVVALVGSALHIAPVFTIQQGHVTVVARARSKRRALKSMLDRMAELTRRRPTHAAVFHADVPDEAESLRAQVADRFNCMELYVTEFTPVMGSHTGPGVLGVAFYTES
jgi:DegV family protein with EDD domain